MIFSFFRILVSFVSVWMCSFYAIVSLGVEVDSVAFSQFWNVLLLFSWAMLSIRSFSTIQDPTKMLQNQISTKKLSNPSLQW